MLFLLLVEINHEEGEDENQDTCDDASDKSIRSTFGFLIDESFEDEWSGDH